MFLGSKLSHTRVETDSDRIASGFWTYSQGLLDAPFSKTLVTRIQKCLAYNPGRPFALDILKTTSQALEIYDQMWDLDGPDHDLAGPVANEPRGI